MGDKKTLNEFDSYRNEGENSQNLDVFELSSVFNGLNSEEIGEVLQQDSEEFDRRFREEHFFYKRIDRDSNNTRFFGIDNVKYANDLVDDMNYYLFIIFCDDSNIDEEMIAVELEFIRKNLNEDLINKRGNRLLDMICDAIGYVTDSNRLTLEDLYDFIDYYVFVLRNFRGIDYGTQTTRYKEYLEECFDEDDEPSILDYV